MDVERIRRDNRAMNQVRPVSVRLGVSLNADGSAEFCLGETKVVATVHGPVAVKSRIEQVDKATLKVTVESYNSAPSLKDVAMAQKLEKIIHAVIFDLLHPRSLVAVTIQPISLDGSFFVAAVNAAIAALLDSGFPMKTTAFAAGCLRVDSKYFLVDPDAAEEQDLSVNSEHIVVIDPKCLENSVAMHHFGRFDLDTVSFVSKFLIENQIMSVADVISAAVREKIQVLL